MKAAAEKICLFWLAAACAGPAALAQTTINGSALALRSIGGGAGSWTLDRNGYVGTYIDVPSTGDVTIHVNAAGTASGGIDPHMNIVLADTKVGFDVAGSVNPYEYTFSNVPAGRYVVRTEFNNDLEVSPRELTIQDLTVTGATVMNTSTSANALAAADSYIQNFRRGDVSIALSGLAPGSTVDVSLKRHAFNFGTAVPGVSYNGVNNYLGTGGTARQTNYQSRLNQHFNAVVPENAGKWASNEDVRNENPDASMNGMDNVDTILDYAQAHDMRARMHNLIWGNQQPNFVSTMLNNPTALDSLYPTQQNQDVLRNIEIPERIGYYVGDGDGDTNDGDRSQKYYEVDVFNESYHTGSNAAGTNNHWDVLGGASGIASVYNQVKQAAAAAGASAKVFVNEYGALGSGDYANWYSQHIDTIRNAGIAAGYGDVVEGIGLQYYPNSTGAHNPGNLMRILQNMAVQGLPLSLTEFGIHQQNDINPTNAANILEEIMRLTFGTADATGFFMWGFHQESGFGATTLFAPAAALYTVNTSDFNTWTITPSGTRYEWLFGLGEDPLKGGANTAPWDTELAGLVVGEDGTINFDGFWGDYELTIDGQTYPLTLTKGETLYSLPIAPGDYNADGTVDAADYVVWRATEGSTNLSADGNGDRVIDEDDYNVWRSNFGTVHAPGSGSTASAPEPQTLTILVALTFALPIYRRARLRLSEYRSSALSQ